VEQRILPKRAFISLGSNIEPEENLPKVVEKLKRLGKIVSVSGVYQNPALGRPEQGDYLNAAVHLLTELQALELRAQLRDIEAELGRVRTEDRYAARTMDLDLCLFEELIIQSPDFSLPDPDIQDRPHLAVPLADLDPGYIHPITGETLDAIANRLRPGAKLTAREDIEQKLKLSSSKET
jgi:2-amino-4-hydroxy-6-hydroxymethyldihydropteridine diphosphokinase